jgi:hypothetical protein
VESVRFLKFQVGLLLIAAAPLGCGPRTYDGTSGWVQVAPDVSFALEDGEQYHREAPNTFVIPPKVARAALRPGQIVKLMFNIKADGESQVERMWVVVKGKEGDIYVGVLDNQPLATKKIRPGMRIRFQPRHIINIYPQRADRKT